jgi:hypothetical protein
VVGEQEPLSCYLIFPHGGARWTVRAGYEVISLALMDSRHVPEQSQTRLQSQGNCSCEHRRADPIE